MDGPAIVIVDALQVFPTPVLVVCGNGAGHDAVQVLQLMAELLLHALVVKNGGKDKGDNDGHDAHEKKTSVNTDFHI